MKVMVAKIVLPATARRGEIKLHKITSGKVYKTFKELTGRAELTLPRKVKDFDRQKVKDVFRPGDPVSISFGYDGKWNEEFSGYVTGVSAAIPIVIKCQDEMWKIKRLPVNFSAESTTLEKLLKAICPGYKVDVLENVPLGGIRLARTSAGMVLEKLKQDFGLYTYMNGKELVCGKYYAKNSSLPPVKFDLERTIVNNGLTYINKEDLLVKVKGVSFLQKGKKITSEFGDEGGDQLNFTYFNISSQADLDTMVKADYEKRLQDGFDGSITGFGVPIIQHGRKAKLQSALYPERNGTYYVEAVEKTFDQSGIRQEIKIGFKAP